LIIKSQGYSGHRKIDDYSPETIAKSWISSSTNNEQKLQNLKANLLAALTVLLTEH